VGAWPDALKTAIEEAWQVFDQPAPGSTGVCAYCCMDPAIEADFLKRKARELPASYVRNWYFAAYASDIRQDHVAWFLPRVMEMLASGEVVAEVGHEVVFQRLPLTGFPNEWPARMVTAVKHFSEAFFAALLSAEIPNVDPDIDSWLCMFGEGGVDVGPLLAQMAALSDERLIEDLYRSWILTNRGQISVSPFWGDSPARKEVWNWYISPALAARMERAAMAGNEKALEVYDVIASSTGAPLST
jgi:hypothetical protein